MFLALLTPLLMVASALGAGMALVRAFDRNGDVCPAIRLATAFPLGIGVLGWLGFFAALAGFLSPVSLAVLTCLPLSGLIFLPRTWREIALGQVSDSVSLLLIAALAVVLGMNVLGGIAPPIDADSLAYHFTLPKTFLSEGHLVFKPIAVEGAIPLLQHMTYMIALGVGGELAMTLWVTISNWATGAVLFALCRPWTGGRWATLIALIFLTTPAVIYEANSGQAETRNAAFVLAAVFWTLRGAKTGHLGVIVLGGLSTGFFVASKYTGLLFFAALGLSLLIRRRELRPAFIFGVAALVAGTQWYVWNWWNTGDPLFPTLASVLPYHPDIHWPAMATQELKEFFLRLEKPLPANLPWLVGYPFLATLAPYPQFESLRVGFGPYILVLLPLALAMWWCRRRSWLGSDLTFYATVCFLAYAL